MSQEKVKQLKEKYTTKYNEVVEKGILSDVKGNSKQTKEYYGKSLAYFEILEDLGELLK